LTAPAKLALSFGAEGRNRRIAAVICFRVSAARSSSVASAKANLAHASSGWSFRKKLMKRRPNRARSRPYAALVKVGLTFIYATMVRSRLPPKQDGTKGVVQQLNDAKVGKEWRELTALGVA